jgi:signal transduction histidine kinase
MKIKTFIVILATIAGLIVSTFTAIMTFVIIGVPIGKIMMIKISLTILSVLPVIGLLSFFSGTYLSKKFQFIQSRIEKIRNQKFTVDKNKHLINEINEINNDINFLSNQLKSLISDLKEKNHNLSNILMSMSHDIKTPLTIINGYIEEMEDGLIKKEQIPDTLAYMKKEIHYLDELTIDMLAFISSMEKYKSKESLVLYDFILEDILPRLPIRDEISLINEINKDIILEFNKIDLKKICINIISNALKHTDNGYIKIYTKENNIYFENNGEKIEEKYKNKIFEPFFTTSKSKNRKNRKNGFGLGLSIVDNLSKNNDYKCKLESSSEKKTLFSIIKI